MVVYHGSIIWVSGATFKMSKLLLSNGTTLPGKMITLRNEEKEVLTKDWVKLWNL